MTLFPYEPTEENALYVALDVLKRMKMVEKQANDIDMLEIGYHENALDVLRCIAAIEDCSARSHNEYSYMLELDSAEERLYIAIELVGEHEKAQKLLRKVRNLL